MPAERASAAMADPSCVSRALTFEIGLCCIGYRSHGLSDSQGLRRPSGSIFTIAEIMFDVLMNLSVVLSCGFLAMPWFFGALWGARGVVLSTGCAVVILVCLFPILFWLSCGACGQGAIAIVVLGPIWIVSALLTVASAAFAYYKFAR